MLKGIHHIAITTADLDRLLDFYQALFGGEVLSSFDWEEGNEALDLRLGLERSAGRIVMMGFGDMAIEFFQFSTPQDVQRDGSRAVSDPGFTHVCFEVDDCQSEHDRLSAAGMHFHAAPLMMPSGASFAYGRDPDGNIVEILQIARAT